MQRPWDSSDSKFCYQFAVDMILKWQNDTFQPLYETHFGDEYKFTIRFAGIELSSDEYTSGFVSVDDNERFSCYVVEGSVESQLSSLSRDSQFKEETELFKNGQLVSKTAEQVRLHWLSTRLVTNNPPRWEVVLWYESIPLSWRRQEIAAGVVVKDSMCINTATLEELQSIDPEIIDEAAAQAIIDSRNRAGDIKNVDDLRRISSLSDKQRDWLARFTRVVP